MHGIGEARNGAFARARAAADHIDVSVTVTRNSTARVTLHVNYYTPAQYASLALRPSAICRTVKVTRNEAARNEYADHSRVCVRGRRGRGKRLRAHSIRRRRETRRPDYADRKRGITRRDLHSTPRSALRRT